MALFLNGKQVVTVEDTECSVTLGSTMPSGMGSPTITRSGSVVLLDFGINIPSGTYYGDTVLWTVEPKPKAVVHGAIRYGTSFTNINVNTNGTVTFNTQQSGNQWAVGQIIYLA